MDHRAMREEILAYKRERILEEAVKLFYERGFSGTTLDDIAGKLGVTKPFIYTHFRSKVELLEAVCRPTIEMSLNAIAQAAQTMTPAQFSAFVARLGAAGYGYGEGQPSNQWQPPAETAPQDPTGTYFNYLRANRQNQGVAL